VRAIALYQQACDAGSPGAATTSRCATPRAWASPGPGQPFSSYQKACDGGDLLACASLAEVYGQGRRGPPEPARARELWKRACEGGDQESCGRLR